MKMKKSLSVLSFLVLAMPVQGKNLDHVFALKETAQIPARVELMELRGGEDLLSCKNFRMRIKEAGLKNDETAYVVEKYSLGNAGEEALRYVLDHTKSYLGFYDYHALVKLKLSWPLDSAKAEAFPEMVKSLETDSLKVISSFSEFISYRVDNFKIVNEALSFEVDLNLMDLCSEKGLTFSLYEGCENSTLPELNCETALKTNFVTGSLEDFHPTKLRLEKTRLSELGLEGEFYE